MQVYYLLNFSTAVEIIYQKPCVKFQTFIPNE